MITNGGKETMKERRMGGRGSALFPAGYGKRRAQREKKKKTNELKGAKGEGALTGKDKGRRGQRKIEGKKEVENW